MNQVSDVPGTPLKLFSKYSKTACFARTEGFPYKIKAVKSGPQQI